MPRIRQLSPPLPRVRRLSSHPRFRAFSPSAGTAVSSVEIGGDTCGGALEAFTDQYGSEAGQEGMVFSVVVDESDQAQLSRNMPACVVYVPDLLRDISGPVGPDGNGPTPQMAVTADIGFYEPTTAKFVLKMEVQTR